MSLDFLPRKLQPRTAKKVEEIPHENKLAGNGDSPQVTKGIKGKQKATLEAVSDETITTCLGLAFSDYTLHKDDGIRAILTNAGGDEYIPLGRLLSSSTYLAPLSAIPQLRVVRMLRNLFPDLEARMRMAEPSTSRESDLGGYELRSPTWLSTTARQWKEDYWESRTLYIENIPYQYHTIPSIHDFLQSISPGGKLLEIQSITFPHHHLDKPSDVPRIKGFTFVVFSGTEEARDFCSLWVWQGQHTFVDPVVDNTMYQEASLTSFRSLPLAQWNQLRDEYLAYQTELLDRIRNQAQTGDFRRPPPPTGELSHPKMPINDSSSPFPHGCLVFLKHIHPATNKTTLRKLLQRFTSPESIDYIDYQKGVDTCLVRFKFSEDARKFTSEMTNKSVYQVSGLDEEGSASSTTVRNPIFAELVSGTREELYWEKIPPKVLEQCLARQPDASKPLQSEVTFHSEGSGFIHAEPSSDGPEWFPRGCLLFIKNVHPETNKTTLRKLLSRGFQDANQTDPVDYVDYQKGLDSCYVRLRSSADTRTLFNYLTTSHLRQSHGLDDQGLPSSIEDSIQGEIITGRKEEVYWEKIPEKVRLAALENTNRQDDSEVMQPQKKKARR